MFGRYEFKPTCSEENDSENWSFPSNYERFSTVNVPKSRLGKRRTISSQVKRDVFKGLKSESNENLKTDEEDFNKKSLENNQFLTHPVNASLTPHKISDLNNYKTQNKCSHEFIVDCKKNVGCLTPFRKENSQPLQEIKNLLKEQKLTTDPGKPSPSRPHPGLQVGNISSEIRTVLNKSFEVTEGITNEILPYCGAASSAEVGDSTQSDIGNNSSFMTAHDIYNTEKNRLQYDSLYIKTPRKGFSLLDMLASPVDPVVNISLHNENENLKNILLKTPGLNTFENFKTPFRSQVRNEMFTPSMKNNPMTPLFKTNCLKSASSALEYKLKELETQDRRSSSEVNTNEPSNIPDIGQTSFGNSHNTFKTTPPSENKSFNQSKSSELPKPSQSSEMIEQRRIFEGLGWSLLPPSSFSPVEKPKTYQTDEKEIYKEISSVLLTPNNSMTNNSKHINDCNINLSEMEVEFNSVPIQCDFTPEVSVVAGDNNTDKIEHNQPSNAIVSEDNDVPDCKYQTILNDPESETNIERSVKDECISRLDDLNIPDPKGHSLDVGFSSTSVIQAIECEPSLVASNEISSLVNTKDNVTNYEETEMVTVQNVSISSENKVVKDVTVIAQVPICQNSLQKNDINCGKSSVSEGSSKKTVEDNPRNREEICEKQQTFQPPAPIQVSTFSCPRPVIKTGSNTVYVNRKAYTVLSMLGRGGSSEVYQVLDAETSKLMAMKFVNLASVDENIATGYLNEIKVLTKLQGCPSVIRMFDNEYIEENKILYVVMEKGDTDFSRLLKDIMKTKKISMSMITYYWTEMLNCVKDIHEKGIIHSDLKPANFLLVSGRLKLIDFGIASALQGDMTSVLKDVTTGTFNYMSPEAIRNSGDTRGHKITYKSDIWSLGCILYNLLYGRTPFSHLINTWAKLGAIADPLTNVSFPTESSAPPHLLFSVRWALRKDPKERPTASELLKLAELTPGPESKLGRQISSLLAEYISQVYY